MKIINIRLARLRVPLRTPFKTALRRVDAIDDVVVMIDTEDGRRGYGSAPATAPITGDTHASIIEAIRSHLAPRLLGQSILDLNALTHAVQTALPHNSNAKAAVDIALHDGWAQQHGAPLYQLLRGGGAPRLTTDITISLDGIEKMRADALQAIARGFTALKLKLGKDIALDIARVKAVAAAVEGRASLRLDPNQAWTAKQAVTVLRQIEAADIAIELIEQPVPAHDLAGLKYVSERVQTAVMADESVFSPRDALRLIECRAADIINIKLMKAGGLGPALQIADLAALHGIDCMLGCMLEGSISAAAAAHLAVARRGAISRIDLDAPALAEFDPVQGGVEFNDAEITLGDGPGLGILGIKGLEALAP